MSFGNLIQDSFTMSSHQLGTDLNDSLTGSFRDFDAILFGQLVHAMDKRITRQNRRGRNGQIGFSLMPLNQFDFTSPGHKRISNG